MPGTARMIAWIPLASANEPLIKGHLKALEGEHLALSQIDLSPLQEAVVKAQQAIEVYGRSGDDADLLERSKLQCQSATAACAAAKARRQAAKIIARRLVRIRELLAADTASEATRSTDIARPGTRFVAAGGDGLLTGLVREMMLAPSGTSSELAYLNHQRRGTLRQLDSLLKLSGSSARVAAEMKRVKQQQASLEAEIARARQTLALQQEVADLYQQGLTAAADKQDQLGNSDLHQAALLDAAVVRHCLNLERLKLQARAVREGLQAEQDYLIELEKRLTSVAEQARRPGELGLLRDRIAGVALRLTGADREQQLLQMEGQRFRRQVALQSQDRYQLVQLGNGLLIERSSFELRRGLLATIGFIGDTQLYYKTPTAHSYIESRAVMECYRRLSFQAPVSRWDILARIGSSHLDCPSAQIGFHVWTRPDVGSCLSLDRDAIGIDEHRLSFAPYGLRRLHLELRSIPYDYRGTSVTCGFRSYYPYGNLAFGLSRPNRYSHRNRFPPTDNLPFRRVFEERRTLPTRNSISSALEPF
jgi:hypothetical protein